MFWLANLTQCLAEGFELWNVSMLYSSSAYVCSYSAIAAAEGFKSPGSTDEYVLTLLAAAWPRAHEALLIPYREASVWDTSVHMHLSRVSHHSGVRDTTVKTSS